MNLGIEWIALEAAFIDCAHLVIGLRGALFLAPIHNSVGSTIEKLLK